MEFARKLCIALPAAVLTTSLSAQTPDLTDISFENLASLKISSASKFVQSAREAPSAVEVVSREDIRRHGWHTLSEALASLAGTYVANDRLYDYLGARGFLIPGDYNTRFLLLIDGQRANDNVYDQAPFSEEFPLDLSLVERIEYVPGPGSSIYGGNAIFGVINVITRRTEEMSPLRLSLRLGDDGWRSANVAAAKHFESGASLLLSATDGEKDGRRVTYRDPYGNLARAGGAVALDGVAHGLDRMRMRQFYARYAHGNATLAAHYGDRTVRPSSALYGSLFDDPGLKISDSYLSLLGTYQSQLSEAIALEGRMEYAEVAYNADYPYDDDKGQRYLNRDTTIGSWWTGEVRLLHTGFDSHTLVGGVEVKIDSDNRQRNFDLGVAINDPIDAHSERRRVGLYLQDEWAFAPRWRLNAGLRHDRISSGDATTSPRLGLIWLASDTASLKLLAGRAYRQPIAYESDYANGVAYLANPGLKPETISTVETVWSQRLGHGHNLDVSVYQYRMENLIAQVLTGDEQLQYQNQGPIEARGAEARWRTRWESGAELRGSLAFTHTEDAAGRRPGFSPRWVAKLHGSMPLPGDRWLLAVETHALPATHYHWQDTRQRLGFRVLVDAAITSARVQPGLDAVLRIRNLFDRRYAYPGSDEAPVPAIPGQGRTWELGLHYRF